jgi:hypothetical protein
MSVIILPLQTSLKIWLLGRLPHPLPLIHLSGAVYIHSARSLEIHKSCGTSKYIFTNEYENSASKNKIRQRERK